MKALAPLTLSTAEIAALRSKLQSKQAAFSFASEPALASAVASLGLQREVLTRSNELAPFLFDARTGKPVIREDMRSELVSFGGEIGVKVWVQGTEELDVRSRGVKLFLHPDFSYNKMGQLAQLVFFPKSINQILKLQGAELVIVPEWALNTIFGGFQGDTHYYQTNLWELDNNDTLRFAQLLAKKQIPFLGTHDLTAHMSGVKAAEMENLSVLGSAVAELLQSYFGQLEGKPKSRASLIIPYLMGVLLDDLAQPVNYGSSRHNIMLSELSRALRQNFIDPRAKRRIFRFPEAFGSIIEFTRFSSKEEVANQAASQVSKLASEILSGSLVSQSAPAFGS